MALRRRGVFGYNLPPIVGNIVRPAAFEVAAAVGRFSRGLDAVIEINSANELNQKIGPHRSSYFGRYCAETFFRNLNGQPGKLLIRPFVSGTAVQASASIDDALAVPTLSLSAAYRGEADKSLFGNSIGYTITKGVRFTTVLTGPLLITGTTVNLKSVAGLRVGDIVQIGAGANHAKIDSIDEGAKQVTLAAPGAQAAASPGDSFNALGFRVATFLKNSNGVVEEIPNLPESRTYLSMEPENTEFYVGGSAFQNHPYLSLADLASSSVLEDALPVDVTTPTFLTGGSDGAAPTDSDFNALYPSFDIYPIRWLANFDANTEQANLDGEAYCSNRLDSPIWIYNIAAQSTKEDYETEGRLYQRSNQVQGVAVASTRNVADPIGVGPNPVKRIPLSGAIMGNWIRTFNTLGFHRVPAGDDAPLLGFLQTDAAEDGFTEDERTDLLESGLNVAQFLPGRGLIVRSFRTPTTLLEAGWGHVLLMQNFIKISAVESLANTENRPNRITSLKTMADRISDFGLKLYRTSYPFGIDPDGAFGTFIREDGSVAGPTDVFIVQADQFNNPQSSINIGDGNIFARFVPPAVLESLGVGVGVLIPLG